jgi:hypothetical protein
MAAARDRFESYFAEKIWELIPAVYRDLDAPYYQAGTLRTFVEAMAGEAARLRRSADRLWEDQSAELCDDWAVPYLGELVATRLLPELNARARRADVLKTIYYRRRKGTPGVLEELISDIGGWDGKLAEMFRRVGRMRHGLDAHAEARAGTFTGTPAGGWADMRRPRGARLAGSPFDEYHYTPDVRRHRGFSGRVAISKLAFHLYRIPAFPLTRIPPLAGPVPGSFTIDPSGRDRPLFARRARSGRWSEYHPAREWELPAPIECRLLGHAEYLVDEALVVKLIATAGLPAPAAADLRTLRGVRFPSERRLRTVLDALPHGADILQPAVFQPLLSGALVADCGKSVLLAPNPLGSIVVEPAPGAPVRVDRIEAGDLTGWAASAPNKRLVIDPVRGRMLFIGTPPPATLSVGCFYGSPGAVGAGTYARAATLDSPSGPTLTGGGAIPASALAANGVAQIDDSASYGPVADKSGIQRMTLQAADQQRPYVLLDASWVLDTAAHQDARLTFDGLWIGAGGNFALVLRGDYERVVIRHVTLDPGGVDAIGNPIRPVPLVIEASIAELRIESSIVAPVRTQGAGFVGRLVIRDSIVHSALAATPAIDLAASTVDLRRVTIFGSIEANRLVASETLIDGVADVTNTQDGCFRYSAARQGSRAPRPYESFFFADSGHFFTSRRFGDPGYAQLSETAPAGLVRGAENGSEMGAWSSLLDPIRQDGLHMKVDEFAPFGLIPIFIRAT